MRATNCFHGNIQHPIHHGKHAQHIQFGGVLTQHGSERLTKTGSLDRLLRISIGRRAGQFTGEYYSHQPAKGIFAHSVQGLLDC